VVVLTASLIPGKYSSEFKLVSVSDAGPGSLNQNPDAMINDTTEDDDLNRAWAALSQRQRNLLRQVEREWTKRNSWRFSHAHTGANMERFRNVRQRGVPWRRVQAR
jgi:hypothetical protein